MIVSDERVVRFLNEKLNRPLYPPFTVMGIERDGDVVAGVLFNGFNRANIDLSAAGTGWTPGFMRALGRYVFTQMRCTRMTLRTEHEQVVKFALRLGGKIEGVMRDYYGEGRDATVIGVLRKEYRFGRP